MGERKGTNHYYPPDYDPKKGGLNKFLGTHALRERARKIHLGILIIRFEMPYNIWCEGCGNHIGMGVRYNAEKTKIGMYYTTPVYQFRMKCHLCDNHFEIKTDPGNLDYVIVSGARRQENRWDPTQNNQIVPEDKETQKKLFDDAMFKLEHGEKDQGLGKAMIPILGKLVNRNESSWKDDYAANSALRASFRARKKEFAASNAKDKKLLQKSSLDIKLLPEHEDDIYMASLLAQTPSQSVGELQNKARDDIMNRPALPSCRPTMFLGTKAAKQLEEQNRNKLVLNSVVRTPSASDRRSLSSSSNPSSPCSSSTSESTSTNKDYWGHSEDEPDAKRVCPSKPTPDDVSQSEDTSPAEKMDKPKSLVSVDYESSGSDDL